MALPNPSMSFSPFAILTADQMNDLVENDQALAAGTGLNTGVVTSSKIANDAVLSDKIDYTTFSNNIKSATNASPISLSNISQNMASNGLSVSFTCSGAAYALVEVSMGVGSATDFEYRPEIRLNGTIMQFYSPSAATAVNISRAIHRSFSSFVPLGNGVNVISAGVALSASTGANIAAGGAFVSAIVFGHVTA